MSPRHARSSLLALAAALALPAAASADSYTLGTSPDAALPESPRAGCAGGGSCTVAQDVLSNETLRVRAQGVVVGWRAHGLGGQVRLRRVGGGATAAAALPSGSAGTVAQAAQLPVAAGDLLAFDMLDGAQLSLEPDPLHIGGYAVGIWTPALADGEARAPGEQFEGWLYAQATVESDADGDGLGDDTQDPDHGQPPVVIPPPGGGTPPGGGGTPPGGGGTPPGGERAPALPEVPKRGPAPKLPATAGASARGVVALLLANPYRAALSGTVTLKQGRARVAATKLTLPAGGSRALKLKLGKGALAALRARRRVKLTLAVALKAKGGKARTTTRTLTITLAGGEARRAPGRGAPGFDGTYRASDGQTMVVAGGVVTSFNGDLTLYCTKAGTQKRVAYFMNGDDPDPAVAKDGSFAWEATSGYGFVKLKFDGRISGETAKGKLVVEDRSPLLGTGRFEFDYCFAGKEWTLRR
jgi:hypothetical protein